MGEIRAVSVRVQRLDDDGQPTGEPVPVQNVTIHVDRDESDEVEVVFVQGGYVPPATVAWEFDLHVPVAAPHGFDLWAEPVRRLMAHRAEEQAEDVHAAIREAGRTTVLKVGEMRRLTRQATDPFDLDGWA